MKQEAKIVGSHAKEQTPCVTPKKDGLTINKEELVGKFSIFVEILKDCVDRHAFNVWFSHIMPLSYENNELVVAVESFFVVDYLETYYNDLISRTLQRVFGPGIKLIFSVISNKKTDQNMIIHGALDTSTFEKSDRELESTTIKSRLQRVILEHYGIPPEVAEDCDHYLLR